MVWKEQVSRCDLGPDCFNNGDLNNGAYNLFDEMAASGWRSPSRVLEVTIRRAYYPIYEKLLHLVFDPFGELEHVVVLGGADPVLARVGFFSKQDAADAFGELHGRCLHTGCCQLDINWGSSQEVSYCDNMARSSSSMLQASTTSNIVEGQGPDSSLVVATVMATNVVPIPDVTGIEPPTTYSMLGLDIAADVNQEVATFPLVEALSEDLNSNNLYVDANAIGGHAHGLAIATTHDCISFAAPSITVPYVMDSGVTDELQVSAVLMDASDASGRSFYDDNVIVLWALPVRCAEWQPWPPPMPSGISCDSIGMRPMPWPSLAIAHAIADGECYRLPRKPQWPPPAQMDFRFLPADILPSLEFMRLPPVRVVELNPWPPPVLKEIGEFLCAQSAWSVLILIQEGRQRECGGICGTCVHGKGFLVKHCGAHHLGMAAINSAPRSCNFFDELSSSRVVLFQLQTLLTNISGCITCEANSIAHDPVLVHATRSWKLDKLFKLVRNTTVAIAISKDTHLHECKQPEAMLLFYNYMHAAMSSNMVMQQKCEVFLNQHNDESSRAQLFWELVWCLNTAVLVTHIYIKFGAPNCFQLEVFMFNNMVLPGHYLCCIGSPWLRASTNSPYWRYF